MSVTRWRRTSSVTSSVAMASGASVGIVYCRARAKARTNTLLSGGLRLSNEPPYRAVTRSAACGAPRNRQPLAGGELAGSPAAEPELHGPRDRGPERPARRARSPLQRDSAAAGIPGVLHELPVVQRAATRAEPACSRCNALGHPAPAGSSRGKCGEVAGSRQRRLFLLAALAEPTSRVGQRADSAHWLSKRFACRGREGCGTVRHTTTRHGSGDRHPHPAPPSLGRLS